MCGIVEFLSHTGKRPGPGREAVAALLAVLMCLAATETRATAPEDGAMERRVSLHAPYPESYLGAPRDEIELEYAVFELARQALLGYNFIESRKNVGDLCLERVRPDIRDLPLREALDGLLAPMGLDYVISRDEVILVRRAAQAPPDPLDRPVTLVPPYGRGQTSGVPIGLAVMLLAEQAGLRYDWNTSRRNTSPACQRWVRPNFEDVPLREALDRLLEPARLTYRLDGDTLLLVVRPGEKPEEPLDVRVTLLPPYPVDYEGARADMIQLHQVIVNLIRQAGLRYDWKASSRAAGPLGVRYFRPDIRDQPLRVALARLLRPLKLSYELHEDVLALVQVQEPEPATGSDPGEMSDAEVAGRMKRRVTLTRPYPELFPGAPTHKITLYHAINALAREAGVSVDWRASRGDAGPVAWRYVYPRIENQPCGRALGKLLAPFRLRWRIRNGQVVIEKR